MAQFATIEFYFLVCALLAGLALRPSANFLELRYVYVAATVLGLCGEGVLELTGGQPMVNHLMVAKRAADVYRYAAVCSLGFWVGYHFTRWRYIPGRVGPDEAPAFKAPSLKLLLVLAVIPIILEGVVYGWDIFLGTDDQARGALAQSGEKPAVSYLRVISRVLSFPTAVVAGLAWKEKRRITYWVVPALLSLPLIAQFSRGMFLPFVAFLFGAVLVTTGTRRLKYIAAAAALVAASFTVGVTMREYARTTGLGHFAELLQEEAVEPTPVGDGFDSPLRSLVHGTTALPRATLAFEIGPRYEGHKRLGYLLLQLPIPSFFLPKNIVPATSLTDDLGMWKASGSHGAGFPYPLLAEMKVFLGWLGILIYVLLGWGAAKVDNLINDQARLRLNRYVAAIFYGLMLNFMIRSFHSGLRSSARPIMYVAALWGILWLVRRPRSAGQATPLAARIAPRVPTVGRSP